MKRSIVISIFAITLLFAVSVSNADEEFRCGSKVIKLGISQYDVRRLCGDPSYVQSWQELRTRRDFGPGHSEPGKPLYLRPQVVEEWVVIEEWEYNLGSNQFIRYLKFENGRLTRITTGDYGD